MMVGIKVHSKGQVKQDFFQQVLWKTTKDIDAQFQTADYSDESEILN